jgi:L-lactate utilization protein LutC
MIFARKTSDNLTSLVKTIDAETAKNKSKKMGSFVVFLSDDEKLETALKTLAEKEGIKSTVLSIDNEAGPMKYNVAKDAEITVVLYNKQTVQANYAFKSASELNAAAIQKVVADLPKILPEKK